MINLLTHCRVLAIRLFMVTCFVGVALNFGCWNKDSGDSSAEQNTTLTYEITDGMTGKAKLVKATPVPLKSFPFSDLIVMSGTTNHVSSSFKLQQGVTILKATHNSTGDFKVIIQAEEQDGSEQSVDAHGVYEGTIGHVVDAGSDGLKPGVYRVKVESVGGWSLNISQHLWLDGSPIPISEKGKGDQVIGPFKLESGTVPVKLTHDGSGKFIVKLISAEAKYQDVIVNQVGGFAGTKSFQISENASSGLASGVFVMSVRSDGAWTVDIGNIIDTEVGSK